MNKEKILTIHNHKNFSGAARSLGELIRSLEKKWNLLLSAQEAHHRNILNL